jgi:hypothetical protein
MGSIVAAAGDDEFVDVVDVVDADDGNYHDEVDDETVLVKIR